MSAITEAANVIRQMADELMRGHTICGEWDGSEPEVEKEYRYLCDLANRLDMLAKT